ncbi:MAG: hypothetical protein ACYDGL_12570 [Bellilinea sp.]
MSSRGSVKRDRGDLSRLRNALSVERAASLSNQIAAPLRGSKGQNPGGSKGQNPGCTGSMSSLGSVKRDRGDPSRSRLS